MFEGSEMEVNCTHLFHVSRKQISENYSVNCFQH